MTEGSIIEELAIGWSVLGLPVAVLLVCRLSLSELERWDDLPTWAYNRFHSRGLARIVQALQAVSASLVAAGTLCLVASILARNIHRI